MDINSVQPKNQNLIETTTPLQASRGNRQFFCQEAYVSYITYANGYVRREVNATYQSPYNGSIYKCQSQSVINKRTRSGRIIKEHCPQKRMDIIDHLSANYKGYKGRFCTSHHTLEMK